MFTDLFTLVNSAVSDNISSMVGVMMSIITPILGACVGLYAVLLAYKALFEPQNLMVMESINFLVKLALVTSIGLSSSYYITTLVPIILNIGDNIASQLLGGSTAVASLQNMFNAYMADMTSLTNRMTFSFMDSGTISAAFTLFLMSVLLTLGAVPFLLVATAYLLVAKIMVGFLLIVGPIFIMMSFFPSTRSFFQAWTGNCFNYVLLSIIYPISFSMFGKLLDALIYNETTISMTTVVMALIVFACLLLISVQIPTFTSSLSGGVGINGLVGGIGNLSKMAKSGSSAGKAMGGAAVGTAKGTANVASAIANKLKGSSSIKSG
jgi:type IV secretion system protein VirB6